MKKVLILLLVMLTVAPLYARKIYMTRHGQVGFKEHYDKEVNEMKLTPLGREQAALLGNYLKDVCKFNGRILVSPILRTVETGVIVGDVLGKKVELEPGIQEVNTGSNTRCMNLTEIEARFKDKFIAGKNFTHPWRVVNETPETWCIRYVREMDRILKEYPGDLLLVTHGGGLGSMAPELCKRANVKQPGLGFNCALFIFELDENDKPISAKYAIDYIPKEKITDNRGYPHRK